MLEGDNKNYQNLFVWVTSWTISTEDY